MKGNKLVFCKTNSFILDEESSQTDSTIRKSSKLAPDPFPFQGMCPDWHPISVTPDDGVGVLLSNMVVRQFGTNN